METHTYMQLPKQQQINPNGPGWEISITPRQPPRKNNLKTSRRRMQRVMVYSPESIVDTLTVVSRQLSFFFSRRLRMRLKMTMGSRGGLPTEDAMTAFSALHLLRNYNQLFSPTDGSFITGYNPYAVGTSNIVEVHHVQRDNRFHGEWPPVLGAFHQPYLPAPSTPILPETKGRVFLSSPLSSRRPRGEKKPIPDDQKDDRYYERRKRNNQAAKKSRDARKLREDQIALRAALLEHENAMLRAQIVTLREETQSLRQLLIMQGKPHVKAITSGDEECKLSGLSDCCEPSNSAEEKSE